MIWLHNATSLEGRQKLAEAEECYTKALLILRNSLQDPTLASGEKDGLKNHISDVAKRLQHLRELKRSRRTQRPLTASGATGVGNGSKKVVRSLPDVPRKSSLANHFAPRTSDFVLKAIDIATALSQQGQNKRAIDVLQHAYSVGCRQRHNPGRFHQIEDSLQLMRQRYYTQYPPRYLQDNPMLPIEMELLHRSSITSTILLPMWDDLREGYGAENVFMPCEGIWEDNFTPELSPRQKQNGAELLHVKDIYADTKELKILRHANPLSITQTVVGDCSLVCSLIICASYQKRFPTAKIISSVIYPQDEDGNPLVNPKGKYCVKMLINGMTRLVAIDDRLPANPRHRNLLCTYSSDTSELWVSLMEKAFVKVCGGSYNFPGSTSSSDLYMLSGWLPDSFSVKQKDLDAEFQWKRLRHSFTIGAVLATFNTSTDITPAMEKQLNLSGGHAYALLDMQEVGGERVVVLRNPWSCSAWSGPLSIRDTREVAKKVHEAVGLTKEASEHGVFAISWGDLLKHFDVCCLSWNPYLLYRTPEGISRRPTRLAVHSTFTYNPQSMGCQPQFHIGVVNAPSRTRMHLVLSRHITDVTEFGRQFSAGDTTVPYCALKVYDVTGHPSVASQLGGTCAMDMCYCRRLVSTSDLDTHLQPLNNVLYRNAASHTVSFDCPVDTSQLIVVVSRTEAKVKDSFNFSLTLYSELPQIRLAGVKGAVEKASPHSQTSCDHGVYMHAIPVTSLKYSTQVRGEWVRGRSCGGRSDFATFVYNPQYLLTLQRPAHVSVRLCLSEDTCREPCQIALAGRRRRSPSKEPMTTFDARLGNINTDADLLVRPILYGHGGSVIDSALQHTLCFDVQKILGNRRIKVTLKIHFKVFGATCSNGEDRFTMYDVNETDAVTSVILVALQNGVMLVPSGCKVTARGRNIPLTAPLKSILRDGMGEASNDEGPGTTHSCDAELHVSGGPIQMPKGSAEREKWDEVCEVASNILRCSSQMSSYLSQLTNLSRQVSKAASPLPTAAKVAITSLCAFLAEHTKRQAAAPVVRRPPPELLPPLPAGEYTLVASLWKKGVASSFNLTVESTEPHTVIPIREEGDGLFEKQIFGELLPQGGSFRWKAEPPLTIRKDDKLFRNSKVCIIVHCRGVFTCRLLPLEGTDDVDNGGRRITSVNVSLFTMRDPETMEMVRSSGPCTSSGARIPPVVLEPERTYLLVVSASEPSSAKYVLRIYTKSPCTAQLTA